jgi:hypothetical protein
MSNLDTIEALTRISTTRGLTQGYSCRHRFKLRLRL